MLRESGEKLHERSLKAEKFKANALTKVEGPSRHIRQLFGNGDVC